MSTSEDGRSARAEPGSFRDPDSRVFYRGGEVLRSLTQPGFEDFQALVASGLLDDDRIVDTELTDATAADDVLPDGAVAVLKHPTIPVVSYPYEWTFSMLQDAALLQLDLLLDALECGLTLKDSSPYNVQFVGSRPVFIDVGSFERLRPGELWVGYRQFCMLYLFPLLLQSTKGVSYQPWLRGSLEGITPADMRALMSWRDRFRRGLLTNVFLHARLDRRDTRNSAGLATELKRPGLATQVMLANVRKMRRLVARLRWRPPAGVWLAYGEHNSYSGGDAQRKDDFVRSVVTSQSWSLVWDLGCNNGRHARIAAEGAAHVVAVDADPGPVELLYRDLRAEGDRSILPLTMNLADPSPGLGWRGVERKTLLDRGRPDLVIALALVHHLVISANVPVREVVDWFASLGSALIVELPTPEDPMVQKLLRAKRPGLHTDYDRDHFETCLRGAFDVQRTECLDSGTRILYFATPIGQ